MTDQTSATLNNVIRRAGIQPNQLKVLACEQFGDCNVRFKNSPTDRNFQEKSFPDAYQTLIFVNEWLALQPRRAHRHYPNTAKLFQPLGSHWVLVDHDRKEGVDGILYQTNVDGWEFTSAKRPVAGINSDRLKTLVELIKTSEDLTELKKELDTKKSELEVIRYLSKLSWADLGLRLDPNKFVGTVPGLDIQIDQEAPPLPLPFKKVRIAGDPATEIPLTDPYLRATWDGFLYKSGIKKKTIFLNDEQSAVYYKFKGLTLSEAEVQAETIQYTLFSPLGNEYRNISYPVPPKPEIQVRRVGNEADKSDYTLSVHDSHLKVYIVFPPEWSENEKQDRLMHLGKALIQLPGPMVRWMVNGWEKEQPLRVILASKLEAEKLGWVKRGDNAFGIYHSDQNIMWMTLPENDAPGFGHYFHEIAGHAYSDYHDPDPVGRAVHNVEAFGFQEYFIWKLIQLFTPEELVSYQEKSRELIQASRVWDEKNENYNELDKEKWDVHKELLNNFEKQKLDRYKELRDLIDRASKELDKSLAEVERLTEALKPLREKALKRFVSPYAIEGSISIVDHSHDPGEDFAEVSEVFYDCLVGTKNWNDYIEREPMLHILGLDYLLTQYNIQKIEGISRMQVFSRQTFRQVLGLDLDSIDLTPYHEAGLALELPSPLSANESKTPETDVDTSSPEEESFEWRDPGFTMPLGIGYQHLSLSSGSQTKQSDGLFLNLQTGYQGRHGGVGGFLGFNHNSVASTETTPAFNINSLDWGVYGQILGDAGPVTFFLDPNMGLRTPLSGKGVDTSLWLGGALGFGVLGNGLSVRVHNKTNILNPGQWYEFGLGMLIDIPAIIRFQAE